MTDQTILQGIEDLEQGAPYCIRCGILIIEGNDSGWKGFEKGKDGEVRLRPYCILCEGLDDEGGPKTEEGEDT